jgi:hypothetical protein
MSLYDDQTQSAIDEARAQLFVDSAEGEFLSTIGRMNGVPRPPQDPNNEAMYSALIQVLARSPKTVQVTCYRLAEVLFGTQAAIEAAGGRAWQFYEPNPNEIVFECPMELIAGSNANASYLHGDGGDHAMCVGGPSDTITVKGKDLTGVADPGAISGLTLNLYYSSAWNAHTVDTITYDSGTDTSTIVVTAATVPALAGVPWTIEVTEGDSYRGDYMAEDATEEAGQTSPTATAPVEDRVYLFGKGLLDIFTFYMDLLVRAAGVLLRVEMI